MLRWHTSTVPCALQNARYMCHWFVGIKWIARQNTASCGQTTLSVAHGSISIWTLHYFRASVTGCNMFYLANVNGLRLYLVTVGRTEN